MSDTRTIYLKNNSGTIYSSDPSSMGYEYLNISDFDSLNPSENSIFTSASNTSLMYSAYDVKLVLTFVSDYDNGRQARADWIAKNQNNITQISVANTNNQDLIFSKQAKIKTIDFIENPYVNGVQAELTLELAGRWQSSIQRTSATVYPYTGGTKKYNYRYSTLDRSLLVNRNLYLNSRALTDSYGINYGPTVTVEPFDSTTNMWHIVSPQNSGTLVGIFIGGYANNKIATNNYWSYSADIKGTGKPSYFGIENGQKNPIVGNISSDWSRISQTGYIDSNNKTIIMYFDTTNTPLDVYIKLPKLEVGNIATDWTPAPEDSTTGNQPYVDMAIVDLTYIESRNTYKYGYQVITDEVITSGYNGFIINIPSQTTPVNVILTAPSGLSVTLTTSQVNVPLQISSDMIGYSLDNFDTFTLLNKGFPASKYWDNLLSVYSTIQTILNANKVTVYVASSTGSSIPFEFYLYKLQDLI